MRATVRLRVALVVVAAWSGKHQAPLTSADSGSRDLSLAPTDSPTALSDNPAAPRRSRIYPVSADVTRLRHRLRGRGVSASEVEKVGVGTAAGGTAVAAQTASRDVVVPAGTPVTIALTGPLTVSRS